MRNETADFTATIDRKEGRSYIITFSDGQELKVPIYHVSKAAKIGDTLHIHLLTDTQAQSEKTELARTLLEEILNGS